MAFYNSPPQSAVVTCAPLPKQTIKPVYTTKAIDRSSNYSYKERPNPGSGWRQYKTYLQCPLGQKWYYRYKSNNDEQLEQTEEATTTKQEHVATDNKKKITYSLCYYHDENERRGKLIVQYTPVAEMRIFGMFDSFLDFARYTNRIEPSLHCFYESVCGDMAQKPHFDLDIKHQQLEELAIDDHHIIISYLVDAIYLVLARYDIDLDLNKDLLIYSSHGNSKISYHVIISHYYHSNNKEAGYFANLVIAEMPEEIQPFVDKSVYSSFQQFRMLGSQKVGSDRPKVFNETYLLPAIDSNSDDILIEHVYDGVAHDEYVLKNMQLAESLITQVCGCYILPTFIPFEERERSVYTDIDDLKKEDALVALKHLASVAGITIGDQRFPYRIRGIQGNRIDLQRVRASYCRECARAHEKEHPYMVVSKTNKLYFYCRRKKDARGGDVGYLVGTIPGELLVKLDEEDEAERELSIATKSVITSMLQRYVGNIITNDTNNNVEDVLTPGDTATLVGTEKEQSFYISNNEAARSLMLTQTNVSTINTNETKVNAKGKPIQHDKLKLLASQPVPGKRPLKDRRKTDRQKKEVVFANIFDTLDW